MNRLRLMHKMTVKLSRSYMASNSNILKLESRGMLQQIFPEERIYELEKLLISSPQTFYCGFDPTADSLHLGNLLSIIVLLHCQRAGHKPIALIGGATAMIGDPSDKLTDRPALRPDVVEKNVQGIKRDLKTIFANYNKFFHNPEAKELPQLEIVNNADWYKKLNVVEFFCTTGRFFRMGDMLSKKNIKKRLESEEGLNLTEFLYQVFQSFDWLHLYHKKACNIQLGGSDQMGNIKSGFDLLGKFFKGQFFGLTTPLVTAPNGDKLGKSDGNSLWLNPTKTSPFELYQFFLRLPDNEVEKYLKLFTFLSETELLPIMARQKTEPSSRHAHKVLAREVVKLVHGEIGLKSALTCTDALYNMNPQKLSSLKREEVRDIFKGAMVSEFYLDPGMTAMEVAMKAGCFKKEDVAERVMRAGGFHINTMKITEPETVLIPGQHILLNNLTIIRIGKKTYHIVQWQGMDHEQSFLNQIQKDEKL